MAYPASIDTDTPSAGTSTLSSPDHSNRHNVIGSAVINLETKVGLNAGSPTLNKILVGSGNGTSDWGTAIDNLGLGTPTIGTPSITGGTLSSATIGTPTIIGGTVAISGTTVPLSIGAGLVPTVVTLTDSPAGTIALNAQAAQIFHMVLGTTAGNRTFGTPANATEGQSVTFRVKQNSNNTGTLVWPAIYRFNSGGTPVLGTTSSYNYFAWRFNGIDTKWDFLGNSGGIV